MTLEYYRGAAGSELKHRPLIVSPGEASLLVARGALVLDATALLAKPRFDGDYRLESGRPVWLEARIPGSRHADLIHDFSEHQRLYSFGPLGTEAVRGALARLGFAGQGEILVYDSRDGLWAARLWLVLLSVGIDAFVLNGGLAAWREAGLPIEGGEPEGSVPSALPPPEGAPRELRGLWADIEDARSLSEGRAPGTLVCALSPELFAGTAITRYARRGHIPGSMNLPARRLLDERNRLLPPLEIASRAAAALGGRSAPYVLYCGGGITAAMLALALSAAGYEGLSVYSGSLQEWSARADLPIDADEKAASGGESAPTPAADGCLA